MPSQITDEDLFQEFDALLQSMPAAPNTLPYPHTQQSTPTEVDMLAQLKPIVEYKLSKAKLLLFSYYKESNRNYLRRCESTIDTLKSSLAELMTKTTAARKSHKSILVQKLKSLKVILYRAYADIIPEATSLITFTDEYGYVVPAFAADIFEHEALLVAVHAFDNSMRVFDRLFDAQSHSTCTSLLYKKRLRKIRMLKHFVIGPLGLNESSFMQFISHLLMTAYSWYLYVRHEVALLGLKVDTAKLFGFLFKKSSNESRCFLQTERPLMFPHLKRQVNETVNGFEIVDDEFEEAAIEFLDYN